MLGLVAPACGDDDGADVRESGSGSEAESGSETASGTAAECQPFGDPADADSSADLTLGEFSLELGTDELEAGAVTFEGNNEGALAHEFVIASGTDVPETDEGGVDEAAMEDRILGEVEPFPSQSECDGTFDLEPGDYVMFCGVTEEDGTSHYAEGMVTEFSVN